MDQTPVILFICEHGAAKSIIAAAYFNKLAMERKINVHAIARGTNPDPELSQKTIAGLKQDGVSLTETVPRKLSVVDLESAGRIVTFCQLPEEYQGKTTSVEQWDNIPPVSENYEIARDIILKHIDQLLQTITIP